MGVILMSDKPKCFEAIELLKNTCKGKNQTQCKMCKYYIWFKMGDEDTAVNIIKTLLQDE